MTDLSTDRLRLRGWRETDLAPFAGLNADPRVIEHFPAMLTRAESDALAERERARIAERGWGLWAVEVIGGVPDPAAAEPDGDPARLSVDEPVGRFIGFVGLAVPGFAAPFRPPVGPEYAPAVEVGWRLAHHAWGHGYATEAARAAIDFGFIELGLPEIVSFTTVANRRSRRVMERLGMTHDPAEDFDHPLLPGSPIAPHVLYRLTAPA